MGNKRREQRGRDSAVIFYTPQQPLTPSQFQDQIGTKVLHDQIVHKICKICMAFGHLILRKIFKFVASQIIRLKCTKSNFDRGYTPQTGAD